MAARVRSALIAASFALLASAAHATPLISEVFYDAVGSDDGKGFVELYGAPGTLLDGMVIQGINGSNGAVGPSILLEGTIGAGGLFVVADKTSAGTSEVLVAHLLANFDFQNGPDSVELWQGGVRLDAVGYGQFDPGEIFSGEGSPVADPPAGFSIARIYADVDSDDNSVDFTALATPTPGSADFALIPEPRSGLLVGCGLCALGVLRRRAQAG